MSERDRNYLKQEFKDGERPSGTDFADFIDSFVQKSADTRTDKSTDGISIDTDGNVALSRGLRLGDSASNVAGSLRFSGGQVQFNNGGGWTGIGSGGGSSVFQPVGAAGDVAYSGGSVGINTGATAPTYRLEVNLGTTTATIDQVRFGNAVCCNGTGGSGDLALFAHRANATNTGYAVAQASTGEVRINAANNQSLSFRQNGNAVRMMISTAGRVLINTQTDQGAALQVNGDACKSSGGDWLVCSDARVKENVRDLEAGLAQLRRVRPVRFRYNGRAGTIAGLESVGVLGQEIEQVFPEMIRRLPGALPDESDQNDLRIYDGSALTFVLVNAVKELAAKVEELERTIADIRRVSGGAMPD